MVFDQSTGKKVGSIRFDEVGTGNLGGIEISLFDGKYQATVNTYDKCFGFVMGVETVLNRMTSVDDGRRQLEHELDKLKEERSSSDWAPARLRVSVERSDIHQFCEE